MSAPIVTVKATIDGQALEAYFLDILPDGDQVGQGETCPLCDRPIGPGDPVTITYGNYQAYLFAVLHSACIDIRSLLAHITTIRTVDRQARGLR